MGLQMNLLNMPDSTNFQYDPDSLLNSLRIYFGVSTDVALCVLVDVTPSTISKIRHKQLSIGATLIVRIHEETGWKVSEVRRKMGDFRSRYS